LSVTDSTGVPLEYAVKNLSPDSAATDYLISQPDIGEMLAVPTANGVDSAEDCTVRVGTVPGIAATSVGSFVLPIAATATGIARAVQLNNDGVIVVPEVRGFTPEFECTGAPAAGGREDQSRLVVFVPARTRCVVSLRSIGGFGTGAAQSAKVELVQIPVAPSAKPK
jgi:hypothetical protein